MLVNCVAYQDGKKLAEIQKREIRSYLNRLLRHLGLRDGRRPNR